ncbi:uncharacterized protein LOC125942262 [Dermacentor silvarum]|uniref:uncharacterized protein LOC125942262 n=1 Tax=Dermacentor silvarum TaxID=543639 RepID=UPI002100FF5A|nr:uncharacterized protein LOC125942262 [Dermacentor silvarum]
MADIPELSEYTGSRSRALRCLHRAEWKACNAATSSDPQLVNTFPAPESRNDATAYRSLLPIHGRLSQDAKAPVFVAQLRTSATLPPRQPARSSHTPHKPHARLLSRRTPAAPTFAAADARISCFFNSCAGITLARATAVARLQDVAVAAEVSNDDDVDAVPVVALLAQEFGELKEHLRLLALSLGLHNQQLLRSYLCFHRIRATSFRGCGKKVLAALEVAVPLNVQTLERFLEKMAEYTQQDEVESRNAMKQPCAADVNQDEPDRLNAVTQSFTDAAEDDSVSAPMQPGERHRRHLLGPSELSSFVLCKAPQPCHDNDDGVDNDNEEFCAPTQNGDSPPLKVRAMVKYRRQKESVAEEGNKENKTQPVRPKTGIDETPPPSPGFVAESDPEDHDGDTIAVTARHPLFVFDVTGATVYRCGCRPGGATWSPIIGSVGKTSGKRPSRGMRLKKPTCDTVPELPSQETAAGGGWMQPH